MRAKNAGELLIAMQIQEQFLMLHWKSCVVVLFYALCKLFTYVGLGGIDVRHYYLIFFLTDILSWSCHCLYHTSPYPVDNKGVIMESSVNMVKDLVELPCA